LETFSLLFINIEWNSPAVLPSKKSKGIIFTTSSGKLFASSLTEYSAITILDK